jgi:hypothetical protein
LNVVIQRYDGAPVDPQRWEIVAAAVNTTDRARPVETLHDEFARAHFFDLSRADELSARGFTREASGVVIVPSALHAGRHLEWRDDEFDEKTIIRTATGERAEAGPPFRGRATERTHAGSAMLEVILGSRDVHGEAFWWTDTTVRAVVVQPTQPLAAASLTELKEQTLAQSLDGRSEVQAAQIVAAAVAQGMQVQLVERWEVQP